MTNLTDLWFPLVIFVFNELSYRIAGVILYGKENEPLDLQCKNITEGEFISVVWLTNAQYRKAKYTAFSYNVRTKTQKIDTKFYGRIKQVNGTSIRIVTPQLEDSGNWECNIIFEYFPKGGRRSRKRVNVQANYDVNIVSPPIIKHVYPQIVAAPLFYRKSAVCEGYSSNPFTLSWVKINGNFTKYVTFDRRDNFVNSQYRSISHIFFEQLTTEDAGRYLCIAKNLAGQVSSEVDVHLQAKPMILDKEKTSRYQANTQQDAHLKCIALGYPRVSFTWYFTFNYEQIKLRSSESWNDGKFFTSKTKFTLFRGKEMSTSILTIKNIDARNWGRYECIAENSIGYDSVKIKLYGHGLPDAPAILNTNDIEVDKIQLHWLLDKANGYIKSVIIERRQSGAKQWNGVEIPGPITSYKYLDLKENTFYEFRLRARNTVGLSDYSEIKKLKTSRIRVLENKSEATAPKSNKKIFLNLDLISLTAICGGILLFLTCVFAATCFIVQDRRYRKRKRRKQAENKNLIALNRQDSNQRHTLL